MSWLGLDVGSSGCKAAIFDDHGRLQIRTFRAYAPVCPEPGAAELDAAVVLACCRAAVAEAVAGVTLPPVAMAITCQGEAIMPLDADGQILAPLLLSSDSRPAPDAMDWMDGDGEDLYATTGHTAHPMFSLFKLLWLRRTRPELWTRIASLHCVEDLVQRDLGLQPVMGWPLAGRTMLFDIVRHDWDDQLLARAGLHRHQLPATAPSGTPVGRVGAEAARPWGLPTGILVVTGGHDQPFAALGAGCVRPGMAAYATGTVECLCPTLEHAVFHPDLRSANLCTYDHAVPSRHATVAFSLTGGNLLPWFSNQLTAGDLEPGQLLGLADIPPTNLLCLPYLTPSGTPWFDSTTPGAIVGLRLSTTRGELLRGLLEGIAFEMRLNLSILTRNGITVDELRATGGASRSRVWNQLRVDVLGVPLAVAEVPEAGCLGAAMTAAMACGLAPLSDLARRWVRLASTCEPDAARTAWYRDRFADWRRLYPVTRSLTDSPIVQGTAA